MFNFRPEQRIVQFCWSKKPGKNYNKANLDQTAWKLLLKIQFNSAKRNMKCQNFQ